LKALNNTSNQLFTAMAQQKYPKKYLICLEILFVFQENHLYFKWHSPKFFF